MYRTFTFIALVSASLFWLGVPLLPLPANAGQTADAKLPMTGVGPAKLHPNLCVVKYRISTSSPECQAFFDQGLGFYYSYVWLESCRSFETACRHDPDCAIAWWGLSRALERHHRPVTAALEKAKALMSRASHREQLLIQARLEEKGMWPNVGDPEARKKAAIKTIDTLLALYDDDEEGWYYRAQTRRRREAVRRRGVVSAVLQGALAGQSDAPRRQP